MRACVPQAVVTVILLKLPPFLYMSHASIFHYLLDQEHIQSSDSSSSSSSSSSKLDNVRYPIKPRTMAQAPIPKEESVLDISSDIDTTITQQSLVTQTSPLFEPIIDNQSIVLTTIPRTNSLKSVSSDAESYRSAVLPPADKNLIQTDSSSYASFSDRCISPSTASYHTARAGDTSSSSSVTGYETPTPQLDDDNLTLSVHSSLSDLSHAETLEPNAEDLDIATVSTSEQKSTIIPSVVIGMENSTLPIITSTPSSVNNSTTIESHPIENTNWYDGSEKTFNHPTTPTIENESSEIREISNDEILREIDINAVGDEFFLFSPRNSTDNEASNFLHHDDDNNNNNSLQIEQIESPTQTSKRIFSMEDKTSNNFHISSSNDPFGFDDNNNNINHSSTMITNLDDISNDDNNSNTNYRRPIQEDILYEVEHENSLSDHSQNTSSFIAADDKILIKFDANIDYLTTTDSPIINTNIKEMSTTESDKQILTAPPPKTTDNNVIPIYILPPLYTTSQSDEHSTSLHIDTSDNLEKWNTVIHHFSDLSSPSAYTSKIRHRHYSVGSYYDHKTTTVTLHPNHSMYFLGSAPVSPLSRTSTTSSESHYHIHHYPSPISYDNVSLNALRRVNPFLDTNTYSPSVSNYNYRRTTEYRSSSLNREDKSRTITYTSPKMTSKSVERTIPVTHMEPPSVVPQSIISPPSTRTSSIVFPQYEVPTIHPRTTHEIRRSSPSPPPPPPPRPNLFEQESSFIRRTILHKNPTSSSIEQEPSVSSSSSSTQVHSKTKRGRVRTPSPPIRTKPSDKTYKQNIYQEIDSTSTDDDQLQTTSNADLQFIRGAIDRVFHFNGQSTTDTTSESSTYYEEVTDDNQTKSKKTSAQYPAVEAIQRFYNHKNSTDSDKRISAEQVTNLDDITSNNSSISKKTQSRSPPITARKMDYSKTKSSNQERMSSDEVDDTLNDIEDVDSHDEKLKRQTLNNSSSHSSTENSPINSLNSQIKSKALSQQTQTIQQQKSSHPTNRSSVSPIEIVTNMVIERDDIDDDDRNNNNIEINQVMDDMVIFYDDIEIVENVSSSCSSESECESKSCTTSSFSPSSHHYSKPVNTNINEVPPPPPPIPARTLKPTYLINNQQQPPSSTPPPPPLPTLTTNRSYELEKALVRKKFDVNTVNDIINRTDYNMESSVSHRHPSARHFVGKLNSDDSPSQSTLTNGHKRIPAKAPISTIPIRSASALPTHEKNRSIIADTNALVKQIQSSLSRNSLHDTQIHSKTLSTSNKDLRAFVSSTYSPTNENTIDDNGTVHLRPHTNNVDEQIFKRQARLSKSFHNVSEYNSTDGFSKPDQNSTLKSQPSKSFENNLDQVSHNQTKQIHVPLNLTSVVTSTSFSALTNSDDNTRMLSMKWYTGQVSANSEICYNPHYIDPNDLLTGYISTHSNQEIQALFSRLQASNDARIHAALDDIRSRVAQFDITKTQEDLHTFMRYLESRIRDLSNKKTLNKSILNDVVINGQQQQSDNVSIKSRGSSITPGAMKDVPSSRQLGRQQIRSSVSNGGVGMNGHSTTPPRQSSQTSSNQENPAVFDEMLNTVLGLPKKGVAVLPQTFPYNKRDKSTPLNQTSMTTNTTITNKTGRDVGKRLFESGTYKDPRLIYDGSQRKEKEEQPLETSV
ncbi:unnamed protein product [Adineta steineri]|uniref:Uncharacterized protein n=2 Tax=Adineta steineri TaxID=433720 RepID=A0A815ZH11_9BILA|nr:unnamed protein product [Adineta steineri]